MKKIKDRILLGMISGIIASIPGQLLNIFEHKQKITDVPYSQAASRLFLNKKKSETLLGQILSMVVNFIVAGITGGIATTYILSITGKDKAIIKSIGLWTGLWVFINGALSKSVLKIKTQKPFVPFLSLVDHILMGIINGFIVTRLGEDSLFPKKDVKEQEKIPVFYTGGQT